MTIQVLLTHYGRPSDCQIDKFDSYHNNFAVASKMPAFSRFLLILHLTHLLCMNYGCFVLSHYYLFFYLILLCLVDFKCKLLKVCWDHENQIIISLISDYFSWSTFAHFTIIIMGTCWLFYGTTSIFVLSKKTWFW